MSVFDPEEFFKLATRLVGPGTAEAEHRTAIGRAYYSCYLTASSRMFGLDARRLTKKLRNRLAGTRGSHAATTMPLQRIVPSRQD
jgi:hypothetical protein